MSRVEQIAGQVLHAGVDSNGHDRHGCAQLPRHYPCLNAKPLAPYGLYVHGNNDVGGAVRAVESITKAMGWRPAHEVVAVFL